MGVAPSTEGSRPGVRVVCASLPGPGHAHPMLAVARALARRGHDVVFASSPEHDADAARAGARAVALPLTEGSPLHALRPYQDSENLGAATAPLVAEIAPDVVVADLLTLGAGLAAEMNGVPWASLLIHGLHTPSRDLLPFGWGARPARWGPAKVRDRWMQRAHLRDLARAREHLNGARTNLGLPPTARVDAGLSPDLQLVATLPALEPPRTDWPPHAHVIGPCLWDAPGEPLEPPAGEAPLVLIAASTARGDDRMVRHAVRAVARLRLRAVVTAGKSATPTPVPPGVIVAGFASHDDLLSACDALVCNGGHGVVARALSHGVPVVVVPGHGDQRENGYRVERAGAGLRVLRPSRVAPALVRVLANPSYREGARRVQAEASRLDGPSTAADLVERLASAAGRQAPSVDVDDG